MALVRALPLERDLFKGEQAGSSSSRRSSSSSSSSKRGDALDSDEGDEGDAGDAGDAGSGVLDVAIDNGIAPADSSGAVPHYAYGRRHCELRLVAEATPHAHAYFPEGLLIGSSLDTPRRLYAPHFFVDTFSLLRKHALPLSSDPRKSDPRLRVKFLPISLGRHRVTKQLSAMMTAVGDLVGGLDDLDEIRELLSLIHI